MNSSNPLVSVICLCYNHERFVVEAIDSVLSQTYDNIELIVVDDASKDKSQQVIKNHLLSFQNVKYIPLLENVGNCKAFNRGWQASTGDFVIDLAADDLLLPDRVAVGVNCLINAGNDFGVHFTDAIMINESGDKIKEHKTKDFFNGEVPEGIIFKSLLSKYFINPVTMMYVKALLDYLGGYDENLSYEDFDLWVRSSKKFKYCYSNQTLVAKRIIHKSHGWSQYRPGSKILPGTYLVCEKAYKLCENREDFRALQIRINYEMRMAIFSLNWPVAFSFLKLRMRVKDRLML